MENTKLILSPLKKTWIFDLDGTMVVHNGYKTGKDRLLPGVKDFFRGISSEDFILILTGREQEAAAATEAFLKENGIRYNCILYEIPLGERILLNDSKPSGLKMSYAVECMRDEGLEKLDVQIDSSR